MAFLSFCLLFTPLFYAETHTMLLTNAIVRNASNFMYALNSVPKRTVWPTLNVFSMFFQIMKNAFNRKIQFHVSSRDISFVTQIQIIYYFLLLIEK